MIEDASRLRVLRLKPPRQITSFGGQVQGARILSDHPHTPVTGGLLPANAMAQPPYDSTPTSLVRWIARR